MMFNAKDLIKLKNKKIVFINNNMRVGGVQSSLFNLLSKLDASNEITLVLFSLNGEYIKRLPQNVKVKSAGKLISILGIPHSETKGWLKIFSFFLRGITRLYSFNVAIQFILLFTKKITDEYDLAFSFLQDSPENVFYGGCNLFTLKKISSLLKISYIHADYSNYGGATNYNINILRKFDYIALVSESCKKQFTSVVPELTNKAIVIKNFVLDEEIKMLSDCDPYLYKNGFLNFLYVGRLAQEKGLFRLLDAFTEVSSIQEIPIMLHIVGNGPLLDDIASYIDNKGINQIVEIHEETDNPYRFMKNANALVLSSFHEAAPMVISEALVLGLKVLTTNTCSAKEMITDDEGWVCENSKEGLCKGLLDAIGELRYV